MALKEVVSNVIAKVSYDVRTEGKALSYPVYSNYRVTKIIAMVIFLFYTLCPLGLGLANTIKKGTLSKAQ